MPPRRSSSQARNNLRRAINDVNREIKRVNDHNRRVYNRNKQAIDKRNREVRAYNAKQRANRQKLITELNRLQSNPRRTTTVRYTVYRRSVTTLHQSFVRLEHVADQGTWSGDAELFDMAEDETANSVAVLNALQAEPSEDEEEDDQLQQTVITDELKVIKPDLDARWQGALYSLSPSNPDAARHFCTSSREILVEIIETVAPDDVVLQENPQAKLTDQNRVQRREKIYFCLRRGGHNSPELATFVDEDINNVMELFKAFNPATHGEAGRYDMVQLGAIKTRVEGAIQFLHRIVTG